MELRTNAAFSLTDSGAALGWTMEVDTLQGAGSLASPGWSLILKNSLRLAYHVSKQTAFRGKKKSLNILPKCLDAVSLSPEPAGSVLRR